MLSIALPVAVLVFAETLKAYLALAGLRWMTLRGFIFTPILGGLRHGTAPSLKEPHNHCTALIRGGRAPFPGHFLRIFKEVNLQTSVVDQATESGNRRFYFPALIPNRGLRQVIGRGCGAVDKREHCEDDGTHDLNLLHSQMNREYRP